MRKRVYVALVALSVLGMFFSHVCKAQEPTVSTVDSLVTFIVEDETGTQGSTNIVVSVFMNNPDVSVYAVQLRLTYNPRVLDVTDVTRTTRTTHMMIFGWGEPPEEEGNVELAIADGRYEIGSRSGSIADFHFNVRPDARCGQHDLTLSNVWATGPPPPDPDDDPVAYNVVWEKGEFTITVPGREIDLSDTGHDFGLVNVGNSAHWYLKIYNDGSDPLEITNITSNHGDYTVNRTNFTVGACDSEEVQVTFTPSGDGVITGQLTISSNDLDEGTVFVNLNGEGCDPPVVDVSVTDVDYGDVALNDSAEVTITITNLGCQGLNLTGFNISGGDANQFAIANGFLFPILLNEGESEDVDVRFKPTSCGAKAGQLNIVSNVPTVNVGLTGTGTSPPNIVVAPPTEVNFGVVDEGSVSNRIITVSNTGCQDLAISNVYIDGPDAIQFSITSGGDPFTLHHGESHNIEVQFEPATGTSQKGAGASVLAETATLHVVSNDPDEPSKNILLTGTICENAHFQVNPGTVNFGTVNLPHSEEVTVIISNTGCQELTVSGLSLIGPDFDEFSILNGAVPFSIPGGGTHDVDIRFTPASDGAKSATLQITHSAPEPSPANVSLSGHGCSQPNIGVTPLVGNYGVVNIGSHKDITFKIYNSGCQLLQVSSLNITGDAGDFSRVGGVVPFDVPSADTEFVVIRFEPTSPGEKNAVLHINSNDPDDGVVTINLNGGVCGDQDVTVGPTSYDYGKVDLGQNKDKMFTITNIGCKDLTLTGSTLGGDDPGQFSIHSGEITTPLVLSQNSTHNVEVRFSPTSGGDKDAVLLITSDDPDEGSVEVNLSGEGCEPPDIEADLTFHNFGTINVGAFARKTFTISNDNCQTLHVDSTTIEGSNPEFTIDAGGGEFSIITGGTHQIRIKFEPESGGNKNAVLRIYSNDPDEWPFDITLQGEGCEKPDIVVDPMSYNFGEMEGGDDVDKTFVVSNDSCQTLDVSSAVLTGVDAAEFHILQGGGGFDLEQGGRDSVVVQFAPVSPGIKNAVLQITSNR